MAHEVSCGNGCLCDDCRIWLPKRQQETGRLSIWAHVRDGDRGAPDAIPGQGSPCGIFLEPCGREPAGSRDVDLAEKPGTRMGERVGGRPPARSRMATGHLENFFTDGGGALSFLGDREFLIGVAMQAWAGSDARFQLDE